RPRRRCGSSGRRHGGRRNARFTVLVRFGGWALTRHDHLLLAEQPTCHARRARTARIYERVVGRARARSARCAAWRAISSGPCTGREPSPFRAWGAASPLVALRPRPATP